MSDQELLPGEAGAEEAAHLQHWAGTLPTGHAATLTLFADGSCQLLEEGEGEREAGCLGACLPAKAVFVRAAAADVVGATLSSGTDVQVWHMPVTFPGAPRPVRALHRTMPLRLASAAAAAAAVAAIRRSCCPPHDPGGAPRRVLAIINPASGPGGAAAIFADQVQPVLEAAGVELTVHVSQRRGHGAELVRRLAPGDADAVLAVGGDGTVFDLLQGLLQRPNWAAMRQVPVAQVPCGSGNALAASTGLWDVPTAAHAVVKGAAAPLDVASVVQPPGKRYFSFLSVTYGMIPVIDVGSEGLRWLGQSRFFVGAVREAMRQATYEVSAAYLEAPEEAEPAAGDGYDQHGGGGGAAAAEPAAAAKEGSGFEAAALGEGPPLRCGPEFAAMAARAALRGAPLPPGWRPLPGGPVQVFAACNLPHLSTDFHFAPDAAPASGHLNLLFTSGRAGRVRALQFLAASETGGHMGMVEQRRVAALALEPRAEGTWLVVDGEVVAHAPLFLEVHPRLCSMLVAPRLPPQF